MSESSSPAPELSLVWYVAIKGEKRGPLDFDQVSHLAESGEVTGRTPCWRKGMAGWKPAESVQEMAALLARLREETDDGPPPLDAPQDEDALPPDLPDEPRLVLAVRSPERPQPARPEPIPSAAHVVVHQAPREFGGLVKTSWILIVAACLLSVIPFFGFVSWFIAGPIFLATFIMSIMVMSRGGTLKGVILLIVSLTVAPLFVVCAPFIASLVGLVGAGAAIESSDRSHRPTAVSTAVAPSRSTRSSASSPSAQISRKVVAPEIVSFILPGGVPLEMVRIPAGKFLMGSGLDRGDTYANEAPVHLVSIESDFYLGKFEVTQKQWSAVMGSNPASNQGDANNPVEMVSWDDCQAFIAQTNTLGIGTYRLPSEAEWEYACRADSTTQWSFGDDEAELVNYAWCRENSDMIIHPVGQKLANAFGLYDIMGNVVEWCEDDWHDNYTGAPATGIPWVDTPTRGIRRELRGGAYSFGAVGLRSATRGISPPDFRGNFFGLRLARTQ